MIENTLASLGVIMAATWVAVMFLKRIPPLSRIGQNAIALVVGEVATIAFWQSGQVKLDGAAPDGGPWAWVIVLFYGLIAIGATAQAHEAGQNPEKIYKRIKNGKAVG
jgi:hypothetical protein